LKDLIVSPSEILLRDSKYRLNHIYYLTKQINPALERVLHFCGIDIKSWYSQMPKPSSKWTESVLNRKQIIAKHLGLKKYQGSESRSGSGMNKQRQQQPTIREYLPTVMCVVCGNELETKSIRRQVVNSSHSSLDGGYLCASCFSSPIAAFNSLMSRENLLERRENNHRLLCRCCCGFSQIEELFLPPHESNVMIGKECCVSTDCPVLFERVRNVNKREDLHLSILAISSKGP
jgi:DNA polymerase zeta